MNQFTEIVDSAESGVKKIPIPLLIGGIALIAFFLVRSAQQKAANTSSTSLSGSTNCPSNRYDSAGNCIGTTDSSSTDTSGLQSEISAFNNLVQGYQNSTSQNVAAIGALQNALGAGNTALSNVITGSGTTVNNSITSLTSQIDAIGTSLSTNSQAEIAAISGLGTTLSKQITDSQTVGFNSLNQSITGLQSSIQQSLSAESQATTSAIQSGNTATTSALSSMQTAIQNILSPLTTMLPGIQSASYAAIGASSAASCVSPNGNVSENCVISKYGVDKLDESGKGGTGLSNDVAGKLKTMYASCANSDGTYNLSCVGAKVVNSNPYSSQGQQQIGSH